MKTLTIPFDGFDSNSYFNYEIDFFLDYESDHLSETYDLDFDLVKETLSENLDLINLREAYAQKWVEAINALIKDELNINPNLKYTKTTTRDYETRLEVILSQGAYENLISPVSIGYLTTGVAEHLKPRSGFIPFYSNNLLDWDLNNLKPAQESLLLELALTYHLARETEDLNRVIFESMTEDAYELITNHINWDNLYTKLGIEP